jgi:hypothetical protein
MGEILPNGEIQSYYGAYCIKCGVEIRVNIQGNPIGDHVCIAPQDIKERAVQPTTTPAVPPSTAAGVA